MANALDDIFHQGPSRAEAASQFLRLKKFADAADVQAGPASTGAPFQDQVTQLMLEMVQNEFKTMLAYKTYAQSVRGPGREGLAEEFEEHAQNELQHADFLLRRLSVLLGGPVPVPDIPPPAPLDDPEQILNVLIEMENTGIQNWQNLRNIVGDNPTRFQIEAILQRELEHVDELFQFLPPQGQEAVPGAEGGGQAGAPQLPAAEQSQQGQPGTPQMGGGPESGQAPGVKLSEKTAGRQRFVRDEQGNLKEIPSRYEGSLLEDGAWSNALDEAFKLAMVKVGYEDKVTNRVSRDGTKATSEGKTPDPCQDLDAFGTGGKEGARKFAFNGGDPPQQGGKNDKGDPNAFEPTSDPKGEEEKRASVATDKGTERGQANVASRAAQTRGQRGEFYGDMVGRILGGGAGWKAGKTLAGKSGEAIGRVLAAGMGQAAGGRAGKLLGREIDAKRVKHASPLELSKMALEDQMNMLAQEQAAEQAEQANSAAFYQAKAKEHGDAQAQLQQQLQQAQERATQNEATIAQMQQAMQENAAAASQSTTQALLSSVQSNTQAIQQRQLAADAANANQTLRDQLRQLADGPNSGNPQGPQNVEGAIQGPSGGPTSGNGQKELQDGPGNAPPAGESNAYQPIQSNQDAGDGKPTGQANLAGDGRQPSTPSEYSDGRKGKMGAVKIPDAMKTKLKSMGFGAAAAGAAGGIGAIPKKGFGDLEQRKSELDEEKPGYSKDRKGANLVSEAVHRHVDQKHPGATIASGAGRGALMGSVLGPAVHAAGKKAIDNIKKLRK